MSLRSLPVFPLVVAALLSGCRTTGFPSDTAIRLAVDTPPLFRFEQPLGGGRCLSPAIDPSDDTRLVLERSASGRGDYAVPEGRYGARGDELLRISCATGRPLGLVPR